MRGQLNLVWFRHKSSVMQNVILCQDSFSMPRGQILSTKLWCPKQRCSSTVRGGTLSRSPSCCFVRARSTGSPCWTPLLCVRLHKEYIYLSESRFSVFPSHWIACLLQCFVFLPVMWTQCELKCKCTASSQTSLISFSSCKCYAKHCHSVIRYFIGAVSWKGWQMICSLKSRECLSSLSTSECPFWWLCCKQVSQYLMVGNICSEHVARYQYIRMHTYFI